jgi:alpha-galactosidase
MILKLPIKYAFTVFVLALVTSHIYAETYTVATKNTDLVLKREKGSKLSIIYYGSKLKNTNDLVTSLASMDKDAYPAFGFIGNNEYAVQLVHGDGSISLDLILDKVDSYDTNNGKRTEFFLKDKVYPLIIKLIYKSNYTEDVIECFTEYSHTEKLPVNMNKYASFYLPLLPGQHWLTHFHGSHMNEFNMIEEPIEWGIKTISNRDGVMTSHTSNPSFMVSLNGKPNENSGNVIAGSLAWSGNYKFNFAKQQNGIVEITAGINEEASSYSLKSGEVFRTPSLVLTYSTEGKGGASRNLHKWARTNAIAHGSQARDVLLNSWEGIYFKVESKVLKQMMDDFSAIGGELFVMDDGWFGEKYPRNNGRTSLGDWNVAKSKLPGGIKDLTDYAAKVGLKFGIWIEPEMTNTISELYKKHPNWVLRQPGREPVTGRGDTQLVLDLCNPEVQDFVFSVVDNLMTQNPSIAYIKWDANMSILSYGSTYLPPDRQSHIYVEYHRGLEKVLQRIRLKYPNLVLQACASGGGRVNYGTMPYFDEVWTSDNSDALQRIYIQWGMSHFFPASIMAAHVSSSPNHQTDRTIPFKYRFDVAMSGRLGMEMQTSTMTEEEKVFSKNAITSYKQIRNTVQQGDLWRILSPYDNHNRASLIYVSPDKNKAVFFAWNLRNFKNNNVEVLYNMLGLDPDKDYTLKEINAPTQVAKRIKQEGKSFNGSFLINTGISLPMNADYSSVIIELFVKK